MGCSASKSCTQIIENPKGPAASSASSTNDPTFCSVSSPTVFSLPSHLVHHPPLKKGDTYHLVSLTSSTYGSLLLIDPKNPDFTSRMAPISNPIKKTESLTETGLKDDSLSVDSVINAWGLMDGLDDPDYDPGKSKKSSSLVEKDGSKYIHLSSYPCNDHIVLYFTSLRGIRKTFEECCLVRMTLRGFQVPVDERDISMDSSYKKELQGLLKGQPLTLPQVFIRGNHLGGAEKIKQLNEAGELGKLLEGFPVQDHKLICLNCGDARFVPCQVCSGSWKVYDEKEGRLRRCLDCNENGLKRCPLCSCS